MSAEAETSTPDVGGSQNNEDLVEPTLAETSAVSDAADASDAVAPSLDSPDADASVNAGAPDPVVVFDFAASSPLSPAAQHVVRTVLACAPALAHQLTLASGRKLSVAEGSATRGPVGAIDDRSATWSVVDLGLSQRGALLVSSECAVALSDVLMGGPGKASERALTELEERVLRRHLRTAVESMGRELTTIGVSHATLEGHAAFESATAALGGAEVLAVTMSLMVDGESLPGAVTLALPARQVLAGGDDVIPDATASASAALAEIPLTVMVRFPPTQASAWDVECLEPGDVLRIDAQQQEVVGFLRGAGEDVPVITGSLGRRGTQRAVRIDSVKEAW